jgi:NADH-quinone oxidoreductase subunit N
VTGSTRLDAIGGLMRAQAMAPTPMQLLAVGLFSSASRSRSGGAVPHVDADAYEGAPPASHRVHVDRREGGGFAAFVRVFLSAFEPLRGSWSDSVWVVAARR